MILKSIVLYPENVKSCFKSAYDEARQIIDGAPKGSKVFICLAPEDDSQNMVVLARLIREGLIRIWLNKPKLKAFGVPVKEKSVNAEKIEALITQAFENSGLTKIARSGAMEWPFGPTFDMSDNLQIALAEIRDNVIKEFNL